MSFRRHARPRALLGAALLVPLATASAAAQPAARAPRPAPRLVVFITVDQMRGDYLDRWAPQLTGGLARLARGGAHFTNAWQDHAITETAPGHSVTLSGRFPRGTGIVANALGVLDSQTTLVGVGGPGASPFRFRGSALIDWMRTADSRSRALSVSRKDRGAILPMGRAHQAVFWYASDGSFTTSSYYADTLPAWVQRFNARRLPQSYAGRTWDLLLGDTPNAYPEPDAVASENRSRMDEPSAANTFPYVVPSDPAAAAAVLPAFPWMDEVTAALALEGVEAMRLGAGPAPDLLAVSFSTTDAIGHQFGPDSRELHDQILRLDRTLGTFIDSLYRLRDSSTIVFALSADHGVGPYPEVRAQATGRPAVRVDLRPLWTELADSLRARGASPTAARFAEELLWVDRPALARAGLDADSLVRAFAARARQIPGVLRVDEVRTLARRDTTRDYVARRWLHMLPPDLPVELAVTLVPYSYYATTASATHGTPHDYDASVPVLFYGPWITPGRYTQRALVADIAPTLARILGVQPTERMDGRVLERAVKR